MHVDEQPPLMYYVESDDVAELNRIQQVLQECTTRRVVVSGQFVAQVGPGVFSVTQSLDGYTHTLSAPTIEGLMELVETFRKDAKAGG